MSPLVECPACGTLNHTLPNPDRCYSCGYEWSDDDAEGVEKALGGA